MTRSYALAMRLREVFLDGKWIANTNVKQEILSINWHEATQKISNLNSIAALTYHLNYYLKGLLHTFKTGKIDMHDKYSFDLPPIIKEEEWKILVTNFIENVESFADEVEVMSDAFLDQYFIEERYGTNLRGIEGIIEHSYYHLGQMVLIKKLIQNKERA